MFTTTAENTGFTLFKLLNGSIIVLALLTVLEGAALTEWSAVATIFITLIANAVAEAFARGLADEIANKRRTSLPEAVALLRRSLVVVVPGIVPAVAFATVALGWLPLGTAFVSACWTLVLALFAAGYWACAVNGTRVWRGLMYGTIISTFGLAIVALRLIAP
ncbi:MAG: hypothetical protein GW848_14285 [Rhodoferax sp.]|nr:hypothetical protein [Rhodoferax sp.]NCP56062.1 hypothetical protein [Rhodoferax sp.]